MLEFVNHVSVGFRENKRIDVIYTNFSKAFDKVNHLILVKSLNLLVLKQVDNEWYGIENGSDVPFP